MNLQLILSAVSPLVLAPPITTRAWSRCFSFQHTNIWCKQKQSSTFHKFSGLKQQLISTESTEKPSKSTEKPSEGAQNMIAIVLSLPHRDKDNILLATEQRWERFNNMQLVQQIQNCWYKREKYHPSERYTTFRLDKVKKPCEMTSARGNGRIAWCYLHSLIAQISQMCDI